MTSIW